MIINLVFYARSNHIEVDYHYIRERVSLGLLVTKYIQTQSQIADVFTKLQLKPALDLLRDKLCISIMLNLRE